MAKLISTEPALRQLEEIIDYIALDKPLAAQSDARAIFSITDNVERFKLHGRAITEFPMPNYRQIWANHVGFIINNQNRHLYTACLSCRISIQDGVYN